LRDGLLSIYIHDLNNGDQMRLSVDSLRRSFVVFAVIIALCCLPGCGVLAGVLGTFDDTDDGPLPNQRDNDDDSLSSGLQLQDDVMHPRPGDPESRSRSRPSVESESAAPTQEIAPAPYTAF
jgi:hypothetical protein